jgi:hypothetical protein
MIASERSLPVRFAKMVFGSGFMAVGRAESELVEKQGSAVVQSELGWLPPAALVEAFGIGIGWIPRTVEPVEVRLVIGAVGLHIPLSAFFYRADSRVALRHRECIIDSNEKPWICVALAARSPTIPVR